MKKSKEDIFVSIWISLGISIILFYTIFSFCIGGSAINGYMEAGKYFVTSHERVAEVSKTVWTISKISGILFWVFIPLTPIGAFFIHNIFEKIEHRKNRME